MKARREFLDRRAPQGEVAAVERLGGDIADILQYRRPALERPGCSQRKACSYKFASFHLG